MSKKSRRTRAKYRASGKLAKRVPVESVQATRSTFEPKTSASSVLTAPPPAKLARHQYVLSDLRRIGIIAGALFLILIVLTFMLG